MRQVTAWPAVAADAANLDPSPQPSITFAALLPGVIESAHEPTSFTHTCSRSDAPQVSLTERLDG